MEDSSFFRDQAERCRRQAENAGSILQITLETLAVDCIAYADELDYPDDYWFANRAQTETETTSPTKPRWSAIQKILVGILVIMAPGIFVLAALMLLKEIPLSEPEQLCCEEPPRAESVD